MNPSLRQLLTLIVTLITPVVLILGAVRLILFPWYLNFEYRTPGFPDDPYGFTQEERLRYSRISMDFLTNDQDINFVADLRFPEGEQAPPPTCAQMDDCTRLFNDRELVHFIDTKNIVRGVLTVFYILGGGLLLLGVWAWQGRWWADFTQALARGGIITVVLIGVILAVVVLAFGPFFTFFHNIFFPPGTWTFPTSDTFIRLFPERFWRDTFIAVGAISSIAGLLLALFLKRR